MNDPVVKLDELAAKFKKNGKLKKGDCLQAEQYLVSLLQEPEHRDRAYGLMLSLPPDTAGSAFRNVWLESEKENDREALVTGLLNYRDFTGESGYNRLMELCKLFVTFSPVVAYRFLVALSEKLTASGNQKPADKFLAKFKDSLLKSNELLKISPGKYDMTSMEAESLATLILYALLSTEWENPEQDAKWKKIYLKWLDQFGIKPRLSLINDIQKGTANWPGELQQLGVEIGLLNMVTTKLLNETAVAPALPAESLYDMKKVDCSGIQPEQSTTAHDRQKTAGKAVAEKTSDKSKNVSGHDKSVGIPRHIDKFNAVLYLDHLREYIQSLEDQIKENRTEFIKARMEADTERKKRVATENRLIEVEKDLNEAQHNIQKVRTELVGERDKVAELSRQLEETKRKHDNEKSDLIEIIEHRSKQAAQQVKNRLVRLMRTEYQDFIQIDNDSMTSELGENLRVQLRNIFRILAEEDIKL